MPGELVVSTEELRQYNRPMKPETITDWQLYIGILTLGNLPHLILHWTRKKIGTFLQRLALLATQNRKFTGYNISHLENYLAYFMIWPIESVWFTVLKCSFSELR